jgi:hypothetical protein
MSGRFITYVIIGVAFGFTQLWFVYWVVKLFKEKQRILAARKAARPAVPSRRTAPPAGESAAGSTGNAGPSVDRPPTSQRT